MILDAQRAGVKSVRDVYAASDYAGVNAAETWAEFVAAHANGEDLGVFSRLFNTMIQLMREGRADYDGSI
jgi:hypothetical protein